MPGLSKENPLKNVFNKKVISDFASNVINNYSRFDKQGFLNEVLKGFENLKYLERCIRIRDVLKKYLPEDYITTIKIILKSIGPEIENPGDTPWESFIILPLCSFVSEYGRNNFDVSLNALYELTKRFTAEAYLRTFIEIDYNKTMKILEKWCEDSSAHVRRLVSEGTRPRLPLAGRIKRFQENPEPVIRLLEKLKNDESLYVRRSVANSINDIAKDNPDTAINLLGKWNKTDNIDVKWIVKHASRYLIKQGNIKVLEILGYNTDVKITVSDFELDKKEYILNETVFFNFNIKSESVNIESLIIDYIIEFVKANKKSSEKVFKIKQIKIKPDQTISIKKKHKLKNTSGRKHYSGKHFISLQINGKRFLKNRFLLNI